MRKLCSVALVLLAGCGASSYGASRDGTFPPRPVGADYPNWEHQCLEVKKGNATQVLNDSGKAGWDLVAMTQQNGVDLWCFKRPRAAK